MSWLWRIRSRSEKTPERLEIRVASASSVIDMRGSSEGCASSGFMPLAWRDEKPEFMSLASANRTSVRRREKYWDVFVRVNSWTRYTTLSLDIGLEVVAEFENRGACPVPKFKIARGQFELSKVTSRRMSPFSPKSRSESSAPPMVIVFAGSGSREDVPGCVLSFRAEPPECLDAQPVVGVFGFGVRVFVGCDFGLGSVFLHGVALLALVEGVLSVDVWAVLDVRLDLVFMAKLRC